MNLTSLLLEALNLLFIGMVFVTSFLGILVVIIPLLNKVVPDDPVPAKAAIEPASSPDRVEQETLVAVISAAVQQYRNRHPSDKS